METGLLREGVWPVAGVDEVGRGPLAGPVAAAAVILDPKRLPRGIDDSKALTAKAREAVFARIMETAVAVGLSYASAAEIDSTDIHKATLVAMSRAVRALSLRPVHVLVDGRHLPDLPCSAVAIIRGDAASLSIAAASIVAKVTRDRLMRHVASLYPGYGFEDNVGYSTKRHRSALALLGPTPFHRMSFAPLRED